MADTLLSLIEELLDPDKATCYISAIEQCPGAYEIDFTDWETRARAAVAAHKGPPKMIDSMAQRNLDHGAKFPYESRCPETGNMNVVPATDWAHAAARGILSDLSDRRGIKWELEKVDGAVRFEIVEMMSEIIRLAHAAAQTPVT